MEGADNKETGIRGRGGRGSGRGGDRGGRSGRGRGGRGGHGDRGSHGGDSEANKLQHITLYSITPDEINAIKEEELKSVEQSKIGIQSLLTNVPKDNIILLDQAIKAETKKK